jgi:hypothetical protein
MEVGKGIVYPRTYTLDDVPIDNVSFAVVKVDMVHENAKNLNLEVPPDDTTLTLRDAVTRRVQWRRTSIDVLPTMPQQTTPTQSQHEPHALEIPEIRQEVPLEDPPLPPSPPQTRSTPPAKAKDTQALKQKTTARSKSQTEQKSSKGKQPLRQPSKDKLKSISAAMTAANPKYVKGKRMLPVNELRAAGRFCVELHNYYINNWRKIDVIVVKYDKTHFLTADEGLFIITFSDLYDLFNLDALDVSLMRCFAL